MLNRCILLATIAVLSVICMGIGIQGQYAPDKTLMLAANDDKEPPSEDPCGCDSKCCKKRQGRETKSKAQPKAYTT